MEDIALGIGVDTRGVEENSTGWITVASCIGRTGTIEEIGEGVEGSTGEDSSPKQEG